MSFSVEATLSGIHSRSEQTVKVSRDFDRGRTTKQELEQAFRSDATDLVKLQIDSGFTRISDGQIRWQDFLRPFSESLGGIKIGADLSRWFDTNSFYRKPALVGALKVPTKPFLDNYEIKQALGLVKARNGKRKISIPGPYTLASLVADERGRSRTELVGEFGRVLKKIVSGLAKAGFGSVQINEPALVYRYGESALTNKKHLKVFVSSFSDNFSRPPIELYLHTYFGDCSKILSELLDLEGVSALGIDFTQTALDDIESVRFGEKALACGCVDGRNSLIESPEWISDFCLEAVRTLRPRGLVILPSSELKYLPRPYADEKIKAIGSAVEIVRKKGN
jgi:5-methyltetrahydropteroyltriglutamate--homocysteine methyltransferase